MDPDPDARPTGPSTSPLGALPASPPAAVRRAQYCWTALVILYALNTLVSVVTSGPRGAGGLGLGLAAVGLVGARRLAAGKRSGRTLAAAVGGVLTLLMAVGVVVVLSLGGYLPGLVIAAIVVVSLVGIALVVTATVSTYRPEVEQFLAPPDGQRLR